MTIRTPETQPAPAKAEGGDVSETKGLTRYLKTAIFTICLIQTLLFVLLIAVYVRTNGFDHINGSYAYSPAKPEYLFETDHAFYSLIFTSLYCTFGILTGLSICCCLAAHPKALVILLGIQVVLTVGTGFTVGFWLQDVAYSFADSLDYFQWNYYNPVEHQQLPVFKPIIAGPMQPEKSPEKPVEVEIKIEQPSRCFALEIEHGFAWFNEASIGERPHTGDVAHVECYQGFQLLGDSVLKCLSSGKYNTTIPECASEDSLRIQVEPPRVIETQSIQIRPILPQLQGPQIPSLLGQDQKLPDFSVLLDLLRRMRKQFNEEIQDGLFNPINRARQGMRIGGGPNIRIVFLRGQQMPGQFIPPPPPPPPPPMPLFGNPMPLPEVPLMSLGDWNSQSPMLPFGPQRPQPRMEFRQEFELQPPNPPHLQFGPQLPPPLPFGDYPQEQPRGRMDYDYPALPEQQNMDFRQIFGGPTQPQSPAIRHIQIFPIPDQGPPSPQFNLPPFIDQMPSPEAVPHLPPPPSNDQFDPFGPQPPHTQQVVSARFHIHPPSPPSLPRPDPVPPRPQQTDPEFQYPVMIPLNLTPEQEQSGPSSSNLALVEQPSPFQSYQPENVPQQVSVVQAIPFEFNMPEPIVLSPSRAIDSKPEQAENEPLFVPVTVEESQPSFPSINLPDFLNPIEETESKPLDAEISDSVHEWVNRFLFGDDEEEKSDENQGKPITIDYDYGPEPVHLNARDGPPDPEPLPEVPVNNEDEESASSELLDPERLPMTSLDLQKRKKRSPSVVYAGVEQRDQNWNHQEDFEVVSVLGGLTVLLGLFLTLTIISFVLLMIALRRLNIILIKQKKAEGKAPEQLQAVTVVPIGPLPDDGPKNKEQPKVHQPVKNEENKEVKSSQTTEE